MIRPKNEREGLLLSITKSYETLLEQTHRKPQETLEFEMIKPKETSHFKPPIHIKGDWMLGLTDLEVYISIFNITKHNIKFELYIFPDERGGGITFETVRDEIERDLAFSDITAVDLQDDIMGPINIKEYREQVTKKMKHDNHMNILAVYTSSVFQDFKSYLRTEVDLVEDDIKLVLDEYNSSFLTYELEPRIYTFEEFSKALFNILQFEYPGASNGIVIELGDNSRKTKLVVRSDIIAKRLDEKSFFCTVLVFAPGWN